MLLMSPTARALLGQSHTAAVRVQILHGGQPVHELAVYTPAEQAADRGRVIDCKVKSAAGRPILRNLSAALCDPDGELSRTDAGELLSPYDAEIKPFSGVVLPSGRAELTPLGVFRLTNSAVSDGPRGITVDLTGLDRSLVYQTNFSGAVTIPAGTPVEDAIELLLSRVNAGFSWHPWLTGVTVGPLLYDADEQAWDSALTLAESVGGWLHHDRDGVPVLEPYGSSATSASGGFLITKVSKDEDSDEIHNSVVMQSAAGVGLISVTVRDEDPNSPTYVGGAMGERQLTVVNPHLGSVAQAEQAAAARLVQELGRSQTVAFSCVPDPQADVGDAHTLHQPRVGVVNRRVVLDSIDLSLDVESEMTVVARRSVVAPDGSLVLL